MREKVPEHPFRFRHWQSLFFILCRHLIYGFSGNTDCIMRPLTMLAQTSYLKRTDSTIPSLTLFLFLFGPLFFFLASLFLFALFQHAHKYFNACIMDRRWRMKPIRKYLYCITHTFIHISIFENSFCSLAKHITLTHKQ